MALDDVWELSLNVSSTLYVKILNLAIKELNAKGAAISINEHEALRRACAIIEAILTKKIEIK